MLAPIKLLFAGMYLCMTVGASNHAFIQFKPDLVEALRPEPANVEVFCSLVMEIECGKAFAVPTFEAFPSKINHTSRFEGCAFGSDFSVVAIPAVPGLPCKSINCRKIELTRSASLQAVGPYLFKLDAVTSSKRRTIQAVTSNAQISALSIDNRSWWNPISAFLTKSYNSDPWCHAISIIAHNGQLMAIGIAPCDRSLVRKEVSNLPLLK